LGEQAHIAFFDGKKAVIQKGIVIDGGEWEPKFVRRLFTQ
jgi:hypothetical protein